MADSSTTSYITPPVYAKRLGVKPSKVIGWIERGELRAINVSANLGGRPRWRIPPSAVVAFEMARSVKPLPKATRRRRRNASVIEYF